MFLCVAFVPKNTNKKLFDRQIYGKTVLKSSFHYTIGRLIPAIFW